MEAQPFIVERTATFQRWLSQLRDQVAKRAIDRRIARVERGVLGDAKSLGGRVSELRIDVGQGYRVYFTQRQRYIVILLCGGDKSNQERDIQIAKHMARKLEEDRT